MITDTQVLSYYFKRSMRVPQEPIRISSITAAEFLLIQSAQHNKANYYPILPSARNHYRGIGGGSGPAVMPKRFFDSRQHAVRGKLRTDQLIFDFGPKVPTYVEFGSLAIAQLINGRHDQLYSASIVHLDKASQKKLMTKFRFLIDREVTCVPVTRSVATIGLNLLGQFIDRYQPKENKRNTINDVLVLASAIEQEVRLLTKDSLLARFAAEVTMAPCISVGPHIKVDFSSPAISDRRRPLESKDFVNRGWQVLERRRSSARGEA